MLEDGQNCRGDPTECTLGLASQWSAVTWDFTYAPAVDGGRWRHTVTLNAYLREGVKSGQNLPNQTNLPFMVQDISRSPQNATFHPAILASLDTVCLKTTVYLKPNVSSFTFWVKKGIIWYDKKFIAHQCVVVRYTHPSPNTLLGTEKNGQNGGLELEKVCNTLFSVMNNQLIRKK